MYIIMQYNLVLSIAKKIFIHSFNEWNKLSIRWLVVLCRMLRSYGNVIILYADECYAIKPEVNYLMSKVECQVSLHTFSIPPSLFLTKNTFNVFPTMKFKLFQLICKNIIKTFFIFQYHRNNIHTFYCMVFEGQNLIFLHLRYFIIKKTCRNGVFIPASFGRLEPLTFWTDSCDAFTTEAIRSC